MQAAENVWQELWRLEQQYETQKLQFHDLTVLQNGHQLEWPLKEWKWYSYFWLNKCFIAVTWSFKLETISSMKVCLKSLPSENNYNKGQILCLVELFFSISLIIGMHNNIGHWHWQM